MKFFRNRQPETKQSQLDSRYIILRIVGQGSFGKVYVAKQKDTNRIVAIKVMDMSSFVNDDQIMHANNERDICKKLISSLKHDNIIDIIEVIDDGVNLFIVMEYMDGGELYKLLKREHHLSETQAKVWFKEIIEAVDYIHKNNIVHRDLKPENVLVTENNHMKLCDFGFGRTIDGDNLMREYCGSPYYAAPEMVTATPYEGQPADMWSCGVILYSMLSGTLPFQSEVMPNLFKLICNVDYVPLYTSSIEACDLIGGLLRSDPKDRLTAEECLAHPWFTSTEAPTEPKSTSCHNPILYEKANICEEANTCEKPSILSSPINKVTRKAVPKSISDIEIKNSIVRSHEMHQILEELERIKEYKNYEKYIELKGNDTLDTTKGVQKKDPAIGIIVIKLDGDELGEKKNIEEEENQERAGLKEEQQERAGLKEEQQERAGLKEEQQERAGLKEEASKKERKKSRREQDRYRREHRKFLKEEEKLKKEEDKRKTANITDLTKLCSISHFPNQCHASSSKSKSPSTHIVNTNDLYQQYEDLTMLFLSSTQNLCKLSLTSIPEPTKRYILKQKSTGELQVQFSSVGVKPKKHINVLKLCKTLFKKSKPNVATRPVKYDIVPELSSRARPGLLMTIQKAMKSKNTK